MAADDEPGAEETETTCAGCGRRLRDDPDWLWWRAVRDADGRALMLCGGCDEVDTG